MRSIGIPELGQNASRYLGEVRRRETVEVTERGEPVARLAPIPPAESTYDRLVAEGRIIPGTQNWEDLGPRWSPSRGCPSPARSSPRRARMSVERRYLDSLALVKMVIAEAESGALRRPSASAFP